MKRLKNWREQGNPPLKSKIKSQFDRHSGEFAPHIFGEGANSGSLNCVSEG